VNNGEIAKREGCTQENMSKNWVRFQVLTAASMKMAVFWVVAPCSLVDVYRRDDGGSKYL
jgi:hypothetical protein